MARPYQEKFSNFMLLVPVLILLLPTTITAVSLGDFTPRASGLTSACQSIYVASIPNCSPSDFTNGACSSACISSLVNVNIEVYNACNNIPQDDQMLIAAFLDGKGISALCPNVVVTTMGTGSAATTSIEASSSTSALSSFVTSSTQVIPPSSASGGGITVDTSGAPLPTSLLIATSTFTISTDTATDTSITTSQSLAASTASSMASSSSPLPPTATATLSPTTTPITSLIMNTMSGTFSISAVSTTLIILGTPTSEPGIYSSSIVPLSSSTAATTTINAQSSSDTAAAVSGSAVSGGCGKYGGDPFSYCNAVSTSSASKAVCSISGVSTVLVVLLLGLLAV